MCRQRRTWSISICQIPILVIILGYRQIFLLLPGTGNRRPQLLTVCTAGCPCQAVQIIPLLVRLGRCAGWVVLIAKKRRLLEVPLYQVTSISGRRKHI